MSDFTSIYYAVNDGLYWDTKYKKLVPLSLRGKDNLIKEYLKNWEKFKKQNND